MAQRIFLGADTYMCLVDDGAIVLDLRAAKYLAVESGLLSTLLAQLQGVPNASPQCGQHESAAEMPAFLESLVAQGILSSSATNGKKFLPLTIPVDGCLYPVSSTGGFVPRLRNTLAMAYFLFVVKRSLKPSRLLPMIQSFREKKLHLLASQGAAMPERVVDLVSEFFRIRTILYTAREHCLMDSLVLMRFLLGHGVAATLVFGVHTKPFAAHAWVQFGSTILNETVESAALYKPILAV